MECLHSLFMGAQWDQIAFLILVNRSPQECHHPLLQGLRYLLVIAHLPLLRDLRFLLVMAHHPLLLQGLHSPLVIACLPLPQGLHFPWGMACLLQLQDLHSLLAITCLPQLIPPECHLHHLISKGPHHPLLLLQGLPSLLVIACLPHQFQIQAKTMNTNMMEMAMMTSLKISRLPHTTDTPGCLLHHPHPHHNVFL